MTKVNTAAADSSEQKVVFDIQEVMRILPHRYPFLMVDKIIEFVENESIVGVKNVTCNEPFFVGHFPGNPVMPGVLILEAMAQTGAILAHTSSEGVTNDKTLFLVKADDMKWKRPVRPGDTMRIEMTFEKRRKPLWIMRGVVTVDGTVVASGSLAAAESA